MSRRRTWSTIIGLVLLAVVAVDVFLILRKQRYEAESERLRASMTDVERLRTDAILARDQNREEVMIELVRRQALGDPTLHLSIVIDSSTMVLERSTAILRKMRIEIGGERALDTLPGARRIAIPRGLRTIERIVAEGAQYELPEWVWTDRNMPVPADRSDGSFLNRGALVLSGGTLVYAVPTGGPLADSSYVMPGTIRMSADDLKAILPNLERGMKVYLF